MQDCSDSGWESRSRTGAGVMGAGGAGGAGENSGTCIMRALRIDAEKDLKNCQNPLPDFFLVFFLYNSDKQIRDSASFYWCLKS